MHDRRIRRVARTGALVGLLTGLGVRALHAQPAECAQRASFDRCALHVEGKRLVRNDGEILGRLDALRFPAVTPLVASADSAVPFARTFDHRRAVGMRLVVIGTLTQLVPITAMLVSPSARRQPTNLFLAALPGSAVQLVGGVQLVRARTALEHAVWLYNRALLR